MGGFWCRISVTGLSSYSRTTTEPHNSPCSSFWTVSFAICVTPTNNKKVARRSPTQNVPHSSRRNAALPHPTPCRSVALASLYYCSNKKTRDRDQQTSRRPKLKTAGLFVCCPGSFEAQNGKMLALLALRRSRAKTNNHAPGTKDL